MVEYEVLEFTSVVLDNIGEDQKGRGLINALVLCNPPIIAKSHIFLKTRFFGFYFCCRLYRSIFKHFE